jgi:hypothetical protein
MSGSPQVAIVLGKSNSEDWLLVHRNSLLQIPWFEGYLDDTDSDSDDVIKFGFGWDPSVGEWLGFWLYVKSIPCEMSEFALLTTEKAVKVGRERVLAYSLAAELGM